MRNSRGLKVRCYAARLIELKKYLALLPGEKISEICFVMELNDFFLKYAQHLDQEGIHGGFYFESIIFKEAVNMFELIEIAKFTYEGVVESPYKNYYVR